MEIAKETVTAATVKPYLRGRFHQYAFFLSLLTGAWLVFSVQGLREALAASIYTFCVSALFGTSALYHRVTWTPRMRVWLRRLDHSMIFMLIAGTQTPIGLLVLQGTISRIFLISVWSMALAGILLKLFWITAPKWVSALVYVVISWAAIVTLPKIVSVFGIAGTLFFIFGGVLYTVGAVIYAVRRPNPVPTVFGHHEIFHLLVIIAAAIHFVLIASYVF